jgi:hypothetical protein
MMPSSTKNPGVSAPSHQDVTLVQATRANLLLVGSDRLVFDLLDVLVPTGRREAIVHRDREHQRLLLPSASRGGTAVIRNVDTLSAGEQKTLLEWLESATTRTQVITTATAALTPLVEAGAFDETLYYRLNTVYIDLSE